MNEIAKKIQVLKLSLSVIDSVDSLLTLADKNLNDLRNLYKANKSLFSNEDIIFLQSISKLIDNLSLLNSYIAIRRRLKFSERAQILLQNLQKIENEFDGYEIENVVKSELFKVSLKISTLPNLYSKPNKKYSTHPISNPPSILPTYQPKQEKAIGEFSSKLCIDCGKRILLARIAINPNAVRCIMCQTAFEQTHDTRIKVDEDFGGSREEVKKMKAKQWGEMVNRTIGGVGKSRKRVK